MDDPRGVIIVPGALDRRAVSGVSAAGFGHDASVREMQKPHFDIALALVRRDGRWLVARRHPDVHLGGMWEFPGGKMEPGESPFAAAERELLEECDVRANAESILRPLYCEYDVRSVVLHPVVCRWLSGDGRPLGSAECRWVTPAELQLLDMPPINAGLVAAIRGVEESSAT